MILRFCLILLFSCVCCGKLTEVQRAQVQRAFKDLGKQWMPKERIRELAREISADENDVFKYANVLHWRGGDVHSFPREAMEDLKIVFDQLGGQNPNLEEVTELNDMIALKHHHPLSQRNWNRVFAAMRGRERQRLHLPPLRKRISKSQKYVLREIFRYVKGQNLSYNNKAIICQRFNIERKQLETYWLSLKKYPNMPDTIKGVSKKDIQIKDDLLRYLTRGEDRHDLVMHITAAESSDDEEDDSEDSTVPTKKIHALPPWTAQSLIDKNIGLIPEQIAAVWKFFEQMLLSGRDIQYLTLSEIQKATGLNLTYEQISEIFLAFAQLNDPSRL